MKAWPTRLTTGIPPARSIVSATAQLARDERGPDIVLSDLTGRGILGPVVTPHGPVAHVEEPRLAADRERAAPHDLHPDPLLRVVRGGDHDPAVEAFATDREVEHLGADQPDVEDLRAGVGRALDRRGRDRRGGDPHVVPDSDPPGPELRGAAAPALVR